MPLPADEAPGDCLKRGTPRGSSGSGRCGRAVRHAVQEGVGIPFVILDKIKAMKAPKHAETRRSAERDVSFRFTGQAGWEMKS